MPAVQISFVPWMFDAEVVAHAAEMVDLHAKYAPVIISLALEGNPMLYICILVSCLIEISYALKFYNHGGTGD